MAEDAARELPNLPLEDALQLVHLYAERGSPKFEKAALRWLERYVAESSPRLPALRGGHSESGEAETGVRSMRTRRRGEADVAIAVVIDNPEGSLARARSMGVTGGRNAIP